MVEKDGSINFGTFRTPFRNANMQDAPLYAFPVPGFWKNFRLKEWQHFGIITPTHYLGMVIFDAKFAGISFFYVYDRLKNTRFEHARQAGKKRRFMWPRRFMMMAAGWKPKATACALKTSWIMVFTGF